MEVKRQKEALAKALESMKKAKSYESKTLLRWSPDYEQAATYYREALNHFKGTGKLDVDNHIAALRGSARAHEATDSYHPAAQALERAGLLFYEEKKDHTSALASFKESARLYRLNGQADKSAQILMKGAEVIGEVDKDQAAETMIEACGVFEEEKREKFSDAVFTQAIAFLVKAEKYDSAIRLLRKQMDLYAGEEMFETFEKDIYKSMLCVLVLRFHMEDYKSAEADYKEFCGKHNFELSDPWQCAEALMSASNKCTQEALTAATSKHFFKLLPNAIAKLAVKLKFSDAKLAEGPKEEDVLGGEEDGGDPTEEFDPSGRDEGKEGKKANDDEEDFT